MNQSAGRRDPLERKVSWAKSKFRIVERLIPCRIELCNWTTFNNEYSAHIYDYNRGPLAMTVHSSGRACLAGMRGARRPGTRGRDERVTGAACA